MGGEEVGRTGWVDLISSEGGGRSVCARSPNILQRRYNIGFRRTAAGTRRRDGALSDRHGHLGGGEGEGGAHYDEETDESTI